MSVLPEQIDTFLRLCLAYGVMLLLFLFNTVTLSLPISGSFEIPLIAMIIYYWAIYRPTLIPAWLVFLAGIIFDFLSGLPVGLNAFTFLGLRWIVADQRLFLMGQSFIMVWIGFAVACLGFVCASWAVHGLLQFRWAPIESAILMVATGIFLFPAVSIILHFAHRLLPTQSDQYSIVIK